MVKILEICLFSSDNCGVFGRVKQESLLLSKKGYEVQIFSSYFDKGCKNILKENDKIGNVKITRFKAIKLGGESFMRFNFEKKALEYNPNIIIVHSYRHIHTTKALKIAKKLGCKIFLVTHAPFERSIETRGFIADKIVKIYDKTIGKKSINKFTKVFAITKWEIPHLKNIGLKEEKIKYIPNAIPSEFFKIKIKNEKERKILFLGRVAMIKDLETPIKAIKELKEDLKLEIVGPVSEKEYKIKLEKLIDKLNLKNKVLFKSPVFKIKDKISKYDESEFFILPSISEGMSQSLIEAMSRGSIVIASSIIANKELIKDGENGFLFTQGDQKDFARVINKILSMKKDELNKIKKNAINFSKQFNWSKLIDKIEKLF